MWPPKNTLVLNHLPPLCKVRKPLIIGRCLNNYCRILRNQSSGYLADLKHGASLYKEAELFSLPITNPKGRHKTKRLISKTMTLRVRYRFWYTSLPSSAKQQREMNMYVLHCILIIYHLSFYISENVVL